MQVSRRRMPGFWRITLGIAATFAIAIIAGLLVLRWIFNDPKACSREEKVLTTAADGSSVVYRYEACATVGTNVLGTVSLVSPKGRRQTIISYDPAYSFPSSEPPLEPSAAWISPHSLRISIGTVAGVGEQRYDIADLHITYDIRVNLHVGEVTRPNRGP